MSAPKHTAGPWCRVGEGWAIAPEHRQEMPVATVERVTRRDSPHLSTEESNANARLIAAAPDLLAAAREALGHIEHARLCGDGGCEDHCPAAPLRAAIAKAEGR